MAGSRVPIPPNKSIFSTDDAVELEVLLVEVVVEDVEVVVEDVEVVVEDVEMVK
jgi:hypothetical protein